MTLRQKFARALRKWADLIDPKTGPTERATIRIDCDASEAEATIARLTASVQKLERAKRAAAKPRKREG